MAILEEPQELCLPCLTSSAELDDQKRSEISTSHIPAERHRALLTILLAG